MGQDKNVLKQQMTDWVSSNLNKSEEQLVQYFQLICQDKEFDWLIDEYKNYFLWRKNNLKEFILNRNDRGEYLN